MYELLLQFGVVVCEFDQVLFQFVGFFFQVQFCEVFYLMDLVVDVIVFQVVIDQGVSFQEFVVQVVVDVEVGIGVGIILWVVY